MKKGVMEEAYYAYVIWQNKLCGNSEQDVIVRYMLQLICEHSIYCRENALKAIYRAGNPELVVKAFKIMQRNGIEHSQKLVTDGLAAFTGNKVELGEGLFREWSKFSPYYQTAFINFMRLSVDNFGERLMKLLETPETDREVKFAVIRYLRRHKYGPAAQYLQKLVREYDRSFLTSRIFMDSFNGNLIISGAFGLFQKNMVVLAGGYDNTTMGEDMELVVKLHAFCRLNHLDYRIRYAPAAVCWSQAPGNLPDLARQRRRWHIGLYESLTKYKSSVGKKEFGIMGTVSFLYFWIYELLSPYIEIFGLFTILLSYWANLINVSFMFLFFVVYAVFGCTLTLVAFFSRIHTQQLHISFRDGVKAILLSGFELVGLRFILMIVRVNALLGYQKNKDVWGEKERYKHNRE